MKLKALILISTVLSATSAIAQFPLRPSGAVVTPLSSGRNTYGTSSESVLTVISSGFAPYSANTTFGWFNYLRWASNNGGCCLDAPLTLPEGAAMTGIELEGCDNSTAGPVWAEVILCYPFGGSVSCTVPQNVYVFTGVVETPGCGRFRVNFPTPETINNSVNSYAITTGNDNVVNGNAGIYAVRVFYKLQVSPAPLNATFTDVPTTHPYFRFIEALAASGITGGCNVSPPQFCPDAPLTRGQMAVFLAGALGLHWAP